MKPRPWEKEEIIYLRKNYKHITIKNLAINLNRSEASIKNKAVYEGLSKGYKEREYALYKGDELLHIGTMDEIAKKRGIAKRTIFYYLTPGYKRRVENRDDKEDAVTMIRLEDEDE